MQITGSPADVSGSAQTEESRLCALNRPPSADRSCSSASDLPQRFPFIPVIDSLMASNDDIRKLLAQSFSAIDHL